MLQVEPAKVTSQQQVSPGGGAAQISEVTIPQAVPTQSYPPQYSDTPPSVGTEVTADPQPNKNIPLSPPPPYQVPDEQSAAGAENAESVSGSSLAVSASTINRALQPAMQYGDDPSSAAEDEEDDDDDAHDLLSSSHTLDSQGASNGAHAVHGTNNDIKDKVSEQSKHDMQTERTSEGRPSGDTAISVDQGSRSLNATTPNRTGDQSHDQSRDTQQSVPVALRRKPPTSNIPRDSVNHGRDPLSMQSTEGAFSNTSPLVANENHHNNNSHVQNTTAVALSKDTAPVSTPVLNSSARVNANRVHPHEENERRDVSADYIGNEDPLEVQRIMDSLGAIDGMFQFEDLGSRTEALRDHGDSFSSFHKSSQSGSS